MEKWKLLNSRRSRIRHKTLLKQWHFHLGDSLLIVSALKLFLFYLCFLLLFLLHMRPLAYPGVVGPVCYNTEKCISLFILSLNSPEPYSRTFNWDSTSKSITGGSIRQKALWRLSFTGKELATEEKVFSCFNFIMIVTMSLKQSLNLRRNLRLLK